eukprot:9494872-Pyramimonas_sp.AAC.1
MIGNIIEVDANLMIAHPICDCRRAGSALFDLKAAFPSINHCYIWAILRALGIPELIIMSITAFYGSSRMVVQFNNSDPYYIQVCRGIKQGRPLSGLLFSLCFDPVARRLQRVSLFRLPSLLMSSWTTWPRQQLIGSRFFRARVRSWC